MSYKDKYYEYKHKNDVLMGIINAVNTTNLIQSGGDNSKPKCSLDKSDKVFYGSGGSSAIIVITKNKKVYKLIPITYYLDTDSEEQKETLERNKKRARNEIGIITTLTNKIVDTNISPHFVRIIGGSVCTNPQNLFKDCGNYMAFLKSKKKSQKCINYYGSFPISKLYDKYSSFELEYCPIDCGTFLSEMIDKNTFTEIKNKLDKLFFQICFTLCVTKKVFPKFIHYDLFMRNVLGNVIKNSNMFYEYTYNNQIYHVPVVGFFPKINDFGLANLNEQYHDRGLNATESPDFFNFVYDVYDGSGLGSTSLVTLIYMRIRDKKQRKKYFDFIKKYFSAYFDTSALDKLILYGKQQIDWNWNITSSNEFRKAIKLKNPEELLNGYFKDIFKPYEQNKILERFGNK